MIFSLPQPVIASRNAAPNQTLFIRETSKMIRVTHDTTASVYGPYGLFFEVPGPWPAPARGAPSE